MDAADAFFRQQVARYYSRHREDLVVPDCHSREFGAGYESKIDFRHEAFSSLDSLRDYLSREAPYYVSYSTARYQSPAAQPMPNKGFQGADLVFDLDKTYAEEHKETHGAIFCPRCLERARQDAARFYDEFLLKDFGFGKSDVAINFSGSKGFHFHVRTPAVQQLSSAARRQLCEYAAGFEVSADRLINHVSSKKILGPSGSSSGWPRKVHDHVANALRNGEAKWLRERKCPMKLAKSIEQRAQVAEQLDAGNWSWHNLGDCLAILAAEAVAQTRVELDAPVSFDLSRLIRVPNSIHGDSCLIAKTLASLDGFVPDKHAVAFRGAIEATPKVTAIVEYNDVAFELAEGKAKELPLGLGLMLYRKGKASLVVPAAP